MPSTRPANAHRARRVGRASAKPPLSVEALWAIKRVASPTLSPDGAMACAAVTTFAMEKNDSSTELWLFPTGIKGKAGAKSRRLTAGDKDSDPKWSPDGRWIAFTAKRKDDEESQIYLIAPDGGEAKRLTAVAHGCTALKWFPDGKRIAFVSSVWPDLASDTEQGKRRKERKDAKVKAHVTERAEFRFWDHWLTDGREPHVFVCDVATGRCRDALAGTGLALPPWEPASTDFDISPDGRELALTVDLAPEPAMMNQRDIATVDLATGRKRILTATTGTDDASPGVLSRRTRARLPFLRYEALVQRSGEADAPRSAQRTDAAARAPIRPADHARRLGAGRAVAAVHRRGSRPRRPVATGGRRERGARRAVARRGRRRRRRLRAIAGRLGARVRSRDGDASACAVRMPRRRHGKRARSRR